MNLFLKYKMTKKTVMVIDDDEVILKLLNDLLTNEGYEVITALSGEEGIEKLKENKPDILLLDFFMPGMTGGEVLRRIREDNQLKDLKIVFLTAASSSSTSIRLLEKMNISDYIKKPFENKVLIEKIKKQIV